MGKKQEVLSKIKEQKILPLFYNDSKEVSIEIVQALYNAGIRIIEYTNRGEQALINFKSLLRKRDKQWPDLLLGIGTIKFSKDAVIYIEEGADFIVCPGVIPAVAELVHSANILWVPGCMTSTEVILAEQNGASLIKIFPGSLLGPAYINAIKEIFPDLVFMPTGGVEVSKENMGAWFKSGVCAVGIGSKLVSKEAMENKDYKAIEINTTTALEILSKIKND